MTTRRRHAGRAQVMSYPSLNGYAFGGGAWAYAAAKERKGEWKDVVHHRQGCAIGRDVNTDNVTDDMEKLHCFKCELVLGRIP